MPTYLIVVNPSHAVKVTHSPHVFGEIFRQRPLKVVNYRDDFAVRLEGGNDFSMDPILALVISQATIQRVWCKYQQEIFGLVDGVQEIVVEFSRFQTLDIDKDGKVSQLKMN